VKYTTLRRGADLAAFAGVLLVLVPFAFARFVDGDEGVYAYAGRLAAHGSVPYRDFFFEQMPLTPYLFGAWSWLLGESLISLRVLAALCAAGSGALVFGLVRRRRGMAGATAALVVFLASGLTLGYFTVIKTFPLTALLLLGSYALVSERRVAGPRATAAGLLLGFAVDTRLLAAAALPPLLVATGTRRGAVRYATGTVVALLPTALLLALAPRAFVFDNLGYHATKTHAGLVGDLHEKAQTVATLLGLEPTDRALGLQFLLLLVTTAAGLVVARRWLAPAIAISIGAASLLPTPSYVQYFSVVVPFLALTVADVPFERLPRGAVALATTAYVTAGVFATRPFVQHDPLLHPSLGSVRSVERRLDAETRPGERVLSAWPGYLIGTKAWALPDYTNQFAPVAAGSLTAAQARRYHVASETQLEDRIRGRRVRVVVSRNWVTTPPFARWDEALAQGRYRLAATVETARIYVR
jgi:hypothetical protein